MRRIGRVPLVLPVFVAIGLVASRAAGAERYALIVSGASGGAPYADNYSAWTKVLVSALGDQLKFRPDHVMVLTEQPTEGEEQSTAVNVRRQAASFRAKMKQDDLLLIVLIGHGTFDGDLAKFNLVGPDLDASDWSEMLRGVPGHLIVVNTAGASFPFLEELSTRGRVVITATDSDAQRFETVFPRFFAEALGDADADFDKNGRISILEAFTYASLAVRQWYEQHGQLATERAVIDDTGDGIGKEAGAPGPDGSLARTLYLDPDPGMSVGSDTGAADLQRRQAALEAEIEALKGRKESMSQEDYDAEFEKLAIELAKVSRELRSKSH